MDMILETERLRLRQFTLADAAFIVALVNTPGWIKYIGDRNIKTNADAETYLTNGPMASYRTLGFGLWLVERKDTAESIGMCGILKRDTLEHPDLGFAFLPAFEGQGFAHEAASATLRYASGVLGLQTIAAITLPENTGSIKLLEKLGMVFCRPISFPGSAQILSLYSN